MNLHHILDAPPEPDIIDLHLERVNDSGDYQLATPMFEFQKELTDQIVSLHYPDILKYCETDDSGHSIIKSLEICIHNCMLVSSHPYLLIDHYMPKNLGQRDMAGKLADTSGKFSVLGDLINVLVHTKSNDVKNVAVVCYNNPKYFDLVEALLQSCNGPKVVKRYVGNKIKRDNRGGGASGNTNVSSYNSSSGYGKTSKTVIHLLPGDGAVTKDADQIPNIKFDLVIVFDSFVDTDGAFFTQLKSQNRLNDAIVIRLVPLLTIEHCLLFYKLEREQPDYLYKLISSIVCLRDQIGNIPPDLVPIYNQRLNYLSGTFLEHVLKTQSARKRVGWPFPDLPRIPKFNPSDVERCLLTEVSFHYTPYDSSEVSETIPKNQAQRLTYYETKRLQLNYVTNPLKNDYNKLIGILSHHYKDNDKQSNFMVTHKVLMQLNNAYMAYDLKRDEYNTYVTFNEPETQAKQGRRLQETKTALAKLREEMTHHESRIASAEKQSKSMSEEIEKLKDENQVIENGISTFADGEEYQGIKKEYYSNQIKIWELQEAVKTTIEKIQARQEEKTYMAREYENSLASAETSRKQIEEMKNLNALLKQEIHQLQESEIDALKQREIERQKALEKLQMAREKQDTLKRKLGNTFKFLKDTSHLKKRKVRGLTPNGK